MLTVTLFEPKIPPNTGNIARLCGANNVKLDLVGNLGFDMEDKYLKALYVQFSDGTELKGVDAFIYVWSNTRGYNWLAKIIRLPIIFQIAKFCYIPIAFIIFWRFKIFG